MPIDFGSIVPTKPVYSAEMVRVKVERRRRDLRNWVAMVLWWVLIGGSGLGEESDMNARIFIWWEKHRSR